MENAGNYVPSHSEEEKKAQNFFLNHFVEKKEFRFEPLNIKLFGKLIPNHSRTKKNTKNIRNSVPFQTSEWNISRHT